MPKFERHCAFDMFACFICMMLNGYVTKNANVEKSKI